MGRRVGSAGGLGMSRGAKAGACGQSDGTIHSRSKRCGRAGISAKARWRTRAVLIAAAILACLAACEPTLLLSDLMEEKAILETVVTPVISVDSGTYSEDQSVKITCKTSGATIRYTTDGDDPTSSSIEYTGTINVTKSQTVKAFACLTGWTDSSVSSAAYVITQYVYVANLLGNSVSVFTIGSGGSLTVNSTMSTVSIISVGSSGALSSVGTMSTGSSPWEVAIGS